MADYPALDLKVLQWLLSLKELADTNDKWLEESPYSADIREVLGKIFEAKVETIVLKDGGAPELQKRGRKLKAGEMTDTQAEMIEEEAAALLKELKDLKPPAGKGFDNDTKIAIIKAKTALIEKVINIQERAFNVRKVSTFQKVVIDILNDLIDPDKINEFQTRLGAYL